MCRTAYMRELPIFDDVVGGSLAPRLVLLTGLAINLGAHRGWGPVRSPTWHMAIDGPTLAGDGLRAHLVRLTPAPNSVLCSNVAHRSVYRS